MARMMSPRTTPAAAAGPPSTVRTIRTWTFAGPLPRSSAITSTPTPIQPLSTGGGRGTEATGMGPAGRVAWA